MIDLFTKVEDLPGIGTTYAGMLKRSGIQQASDLIWLLPRKWLDVEVANDITQGEIALNLTISSAIQRGASTFLTCTTDNGKSIKVVFFSKSKLFYKGNRICVLGEVKIESGGFTMVHPKWQVGIQSRFVHADYPVKVPPAILSKLILFVIRNVDFGEWIDESLLTENSWESFAQALEKLHFNRTKAPPRLLFDEAIANAYSLEMAFRPTIQDVYSLPQVDVSDFLERLGFPLTADQEKSWQEIREDLMSKDRTLRILYGDVGSGKTFVGFLSLLFCYRSGRQAAMLAPTEILARQHFELLKAIMPEENIVLLTRNEKKKAVYAKIKSENCIIIGTHAIFQTKVEFHSLGLLVIDEQHRFGVLQRMAINKDHCYNVLLMTATPIPRTLKLSMMGPIKISKILSRPQKDRSIDIRILSEDRLDDIYDKIKSLIDSGDSIFWVCPFIEKSEKKQGMDVTTRYTDLLARFGNLVISMHGKLDSTLKQSILDDFFAGKKRILVTTTVIEVGINIPHANTIIIENSELFGLAQLYQLMGRVGRSDGIGRCYFLYRGKNSLGRLSVLQKCKTGMEIAENDMRIRGFGNLLGSEQSGCFDFRFLDINKHEDLIITARNYVKLKIGEESFEKRMPNLLQLFSFLDDPWHSG